MAEINLGFFLLVVSLLFLPAESSLFLHRCMQVFLGSALLVKIENFPLLKLSLVLICFNYLLSIGFEYEVFRLKSKLLLTSSRQSKFDLTIENLMPWWNNAFRLKRIKICVLLFLLKKQVCTSPLSADVLNFPGPRLLTSLVSIVRHLFFFRIRYFKIEFV